MRCLLLTVGILLSSCPCLAGEGDRLTYLDANNPYHVSRTFPRLVTPQWVGEKGVKAVVILSIDDMRGHAKWETYLRPILRRLQRLDGRAPVSIMTCRIDPNEKHLQRWLKEGLSLETHTVDHPCPLLQRGDLGKARSTYERCIDLLDSVPHSKPIAFRMPCCDSLNTPSPRFYAEIFNRVTPRGNYLAIDSSVFNVFTADDPTLPRKLVFDPEKRERFRKYLPLDRSFVNYIEDYPYPYVINKLCWQFPCAVPSDWEAQHLHKPNHPLTVRDWKACIDATVLKKGTFTLVFHPHGWIRNTQLIDLIDHVVARHGKKVKFLTFREAYDRLLRHLLDGHPLRSGDGADNGVRLVDVNADGYMDVIIANHKIRQTRLWDPVKQSWSTTPFPISLVDNPDKKGMRRRVGVQFGILREDGLASCLVHNERVAGAWHFDGKKWVEDKTLLAGLVHEGKPILTSRDGIDQGVRLRDLDNDGVCEVIVGNERVQAVFGWQAKRKRWQRLPFSLPRGTSLVGASGRDQGLRFVDINEDGHEDVMFSNEERYSLHLFHSMKEGWSRKVMAGKAGDRGALPMITRKGTDNGAWFHSRHLWVQNENTALLPNLVDRRSFNDLLSKLQPTSKSPQASLRCLKPPPGFVAELLAAEPLVQDPVAFAWGPDGKFWVVEMGDYPNGLAEPGTTHPARSEERAKGAGEGARRSALAGKGKPGGRVKILTDTDGDGKYDQAKLFLDAVPFPTGILPWGKGVLITAAPDILYAEDVDGDGKADRRRVLYTGFTQGNQQHRVNGLVWGLDNWIHCANGDSGGVVKSLKTGKTINIRGRDLRIRPDTGELEATSGQTQFGRCRDDWGNWFGNNNSQPLWHYVLADHYLRRNPNVRYPNPRVHVPSVSRHPPVYPISRPLPRFNDYHTLNRITSACSPIIYRDVLFGPEYASSAFISEPVHNLVHRQVLRAEGITFRSRRAPGEAKSEFLASTDNWFRPTMIRTGPDGALWVADMYRHVIEHPKWIPADWQKKLDLRAGADKGRIYRIYPIGSKPRAIARLDRLDTAGLVNALDHPGGWQRDLAQQMLLWKADNKAIPLLENLLLTSKRPQARLHALCTLAGLKALEADLLHRALEDAHPGVRRHAVRLTEPLLASKPKLGKALAKLLEDKPQVRLQLAYTLGEWKHPRAGELLGQLLVQATDDPYLTAAVTSSLHRTNLGPVLLAVMKKSTGEKRGQLMKKLLQLASALKEETILVTLLKTVGNPAHGKFEPWQYEALTSFIADLQQRGSSLRELKGNKDLRVTLEGLAPLFASARKLAGDPSASVAARERVLPLLGQGLTHHKEDVQLLASLLSPQVPLNVQLGAVDALGQVEEERIAKLLLAGWRNHGPKVRSRVLDVLLQRKEWVQTLVDALETKSLSAREIGAVHRQQLAKNKDPAIRRRVAKVLASGTSADRQKVLTAYRGALTHKGDALRGRMLFGKNCATCHRLAGLGPPANGLAAGPDLGALTSKPADYLLTAILDPNRAVEIRYVNYRADLRNGRSLGGVLAAETGTSVTLVGADGKVHELLRSNLEGLASTGMSAMPEGLEKDLKVQDLADVLAFVRSVPPARKPKTFPGNEPAVIQANDKGALILHARQAAIYGPSLILEKKYSNLGYWSNTRDEAIWTVEVPRTGTYEVWFEWACAPPAAGNTFVLLGDPGELKGKVASTGNWDTYRRAKMGTLGLRAGQQRVRMRGEGKIKGALIDLKTIQLLPTKK